MVLKSRLCNFYPNKVMKVQDLLTKTTLSMNVCLIMISQTYLRLLIIIKTRPNVIYYKITIGHDLPHHYWIQSPELILFQTTPSPLWPRFDHYTFLIMKIRSSEWLRHSDERHLSTLYRLSTSSALIHSSRYPNHTTLCYLFSLPCSGTKRLL